MTPYSHNLLTPFLWLVLLGLLSGCTYLDVVTVAMIPSPDADPNETGKNHYEPIILTFNKDMIRIKYLSVGPNAEHEQVKQLMFDHCHGAYIETSRVELRGYDIVEADCTKNAVSFK